MRHHLATLFFGLIIILGLGIATAAYRTVKTEESVAVENRPPIIDLRTAKSPVGLLFGSSLITIELATTSDARERGLSGRTELAPTAGLLFVFDDVDFHGFWMKDMNFPIDIIWLNDDLSVASITPRIATSTYPTVFYPPQPVKYVLETAAGRAQTEGIATGSALKLYVNF